MSSHTHRYCRTYLQKLLGGNSVIEGMLFGGIGAIVQLPVGPLLSATALETVPPHLNLAIVGYLAMASGVIGWRAVTYQNAAIGGLALCLTLALFQPTPYVDTANDTWHIAGEVNFFYEGVLFIPIACCTVLLAIGTFLLRRTSAAPKRRRAHTRPDRQRSDENSRAK